VLRNEKPQVGFGVARDIQCSFCILFSSYYLVTMHQLQTTSLNCTQEYALLFPMVILSYANLMYFTGNSNLF